MPMRSRPDFAQFLGETLIVVLFLDFAWIGWRVLFFNAPFYSSAHSFLPQGTVLSVLLSLFFALVYYGTSFQVTPIRLFFAFLPESIRRHVPRRNKFWRMRQVWSSPDSDANGSPTPPAPVTIVNDGSASSDGPSSGTSSVFIEGSTAPQNSSPPISDKLVEQSSQGESILRQVVPEESITEVVVKTHPPGPFYGGGHPEIEPHKVDTVEGLLDQFSRSSGRLAERMERRTNTYLILGIGMGLIGLTVWYFSVAHLQTKSTGEFLQQAAPRLTILLFIELLAGYFLQQYRIGVEDFKYFLNLKHRAEGNRVTYSILSKLGDVESLRNFANSISAALPTTKLQAGETTTVLEAMKANENLTLATLKTFGDHLQDVVKLVRNEK
jgi:hypothetical protein